MSVGFNEFGSLDANSNFSLRPISQIRVTVSGGGELTMVTTVTFSERKNQLISKILVRQRKTPLAEAKSIRKPFKSHSVVET